MCRGSGKPLQLKASQPNLTANIELEALFSTICQLDAVPESIHLVAD